MNSTEGGASARLAGGGSAKILQGVEDAYVDWPVPPPDPAAALEKAETESAFKSALGALTEDQHVHCQVAHYSQGPRAEACEIGDSCQALSAKAEMLSECDGALARIVEYYELNAKQPWAVGTALMANVPAYQDAIKRQQSGMAQCTTLLAPLTAAGRCNVFGMQSWTLEVRPQRPLTCKLSVIQ